ncbi:hypothetical protein KCT17_003645 [Escherichia coli]|nr:hypothetical protein [Escherichia coli]
MTPFKEIGEALISDSREGGRDYLLRPSLKAMVRIGTPEEIVEAYATVHRSEMIDLLQRCERVSPRLLFWVASLPELGAERLLTTAMRVVQACCEDDMTAIIGEWVGDDAGIRYEPGQLDRTDIITLAQHLMQHGISGKAKVRKLQRHENNETATEFNAIEYITAARSHLDMPRDEAGELTMTEFQMMLAAKYPDQKGLTREEYDSVTDDFLARQAARRAAAEN